MSIAVTLKQNKFGRPYKAYPHHYVGLGVAITGGSGSYQMRFKPYSDWGDWFDLPTSSLITNNKDGFITGLSFWHGTYDFQFRDKNNTSDVVSSNAYELIYNNQETGIPMGDTPCIINNNINAGLSSSITIKTVKPNSLVRIYKSRTDSSSNEVFFSTDEPFRTGISNNDGDLTLSLPITSSGVRVCATAQSTDEFESLSSNYVEVNGPKKKQLKATISYGAATGTGRMVTVTAVSGGSGAYSIGKMNDNVFPYSLNQAFEIPFGKSNLFIRDNNAETNVEWQISVAVDGGSSSQTFYTQDIRSGFSTSNANGTVKYGKLVGSTFTVANEYGNHDGRTSWGFSGTNFPAVGIVENNSFILAPDRLLLHPNVGEHACIRYLAEAAGTFSISGNSLRISRTDNPWATPTPLSNLTTIFKILHNGTLKYSYTHTTQGGNENFSLNFSVANGDTIDLVVECGAESDYSFDHVHLKAAWSLATTGGAITAPTAPTISNSTPILTGNTLNGSGVTAGDYIVIYKDGYPESLGITSGANFTHGAMYDGTWKAKIARSKVLSAFSNAIVTNQTGNTAPAPPTLLQSSSIVSTQIAGTSAQAGTILVFRNGSQLSESVTTTSGVGGYSWSYTPSEVGDYAFKLSNSNGISDASSILTVSRKRKFTIKNGNFCTVELTNLQSGSGDSAEAVDNWTDGLTFEHNGTLTSSSRAFVRPKTNTSNVSQGLLILGNL